MTVTTPAQRQQIHRRMEQAAQVFSLPFRAQQWRGTGGNWLGAGTGSSFDYQDHRPYLPGDDLRYIDWSAYARTGHYIMKLFREEVSPAVDLVLDGSRSLFEDPEKQQRTLELLFFCAESAMQSGASLRCTVATGSTQILLGVDELLAGALPAVPEVGETAAAPALGKVPWRAASLRVLISDLLFPGQPEPMLKALIQGRGRGVVFAPFTAEEAAPQWSGNLQLVDCESGNIRIQRVNASILERYSSGYTRHFDLWKTACRRYAVPMARVASQATFEQALLAEAVPEGVVNVCGGL